MEDYKKIIDTLGPKSKLCYHNLPDDRKQTFLDECIIAKWGKFYPKNILTRAVAVQMLSNIEKVGK